MFKLNNTFLKIFYILNIITNVYSQVTIDITHLYHSGFLVEFDNTAMIFDYFPNQDSDVQNSVNGYIETKYLKSKTVYVFISHEHKDHFNPELIDFKNVIKNIHYFVSKEVAQKDDRYNRSDYITVVDHVSQIVHKDLTIKTIRSSDSGVAFLIKTPELTLNHSGDHASWNWKNSSTADEAFIRNLGSQLGVQKIDLAMLTCDPRLQNSGYSGFFNFIEKYQPIVSVPMHFKGNYIGTARLDQEVKMINYSGYMWLPKKPGDHYRFQVRHF